MILSARSMGDVNVQVVLEKLGGGGNAATAGAQVPGKTVDEVTSCSSRPSTSIWRTNKVSAGGQGQGRSETRLRKRAL